jgi:hypothetical protein
MPMAGEGCQVPLVETVPPSRMPRTLERRPR